MKEKNIKIHDFELQFLIEEDTWRLSLTKSQTRVREVSQLTLIKEPSDYFVPVKIEDDNDAFTFVYSIPSRAKTWKDIVKLNRNDKLRLLLNVARFQACLNTRMSFFLHPNNLIFDDNLIPKLVYRGIRDYVPPYEMSEETFLLQYKCLSIALFSKKFTFDELYAGSIKHIKDSDFEKKLASFDENESLVAYLEKEYVKEQKETEETMSLVPKKRFVLFKRLAISMLVLSVLLAIPLVYFSLVKAPYQEDLLEAHRDFLASDYGKVITDLNEIDPEKLPDPAKYILAYSYVMTEKLSEDQKTAIMNNISLKSDRNYLLYWIYNGRGNFEKTVDLAKYIDDPQLIMYAIIKQIEQAKNDPNLSGSERDEHVRSLHNELNDYRNEYGLEEDDELGFPDQEAVPANTDKDEQEHRKTDDTNKNKKKSDETPKKDRK